MISWSIVAHDANSTARPRRHGCGSNQGRLVSRRCRLQGTKSTAAIWLRGSRPRAGQGGNTPGRGIGYGQMSLRSKIIDPIATVSVPIGCSTKEFQRCDMGAPHYQTQKSRQKRSPNPLTIASLLDTMPPLCQSAVAVRPRSVPFDFVHVVRLVVDFSRLFAGFNACGFRAERVEA
jgi:hypothetical protein